MAKKATTKDIIAELSSKMKPAHVRFVYLFLGSEDGKCFNNATLSYIRAFDKDVSMEKQDDGKYSKDYLSCKSMGSALLTKLDTKRLRDAILLEAGFNPDTVKRRLAELAYQNKNLVIAHASTRDIAKITGVMKDDSKQVDIPQLSELTNVIKSILTP